MASIEPPYQALVFGASGITGWAIAGELLQYPTPSTFKSIIGLTNRPLSKAEALLPDDDRLQLYSGIDLSASPAEVESKLKQVKGLEAVTHVYFLSYTGHGTGFEGIKKANVTNLENAVSAVEKLCSRLRFWTFQTGGKSYGFEFANHIGLPPTPLQETTPRIPEPYASNIMYHAQYDTLAKLSNGKTWSFAEIRPDGVSGFVPSGNAMNLAQALALFLSFYADSEGSGAQVPYPGPQAAYTALHSDSQQSLLARFHIYASLHPEQTAGEAFNISDDPAGITWQTVWPKICAYFGLVGIDPTDESAPNEPFNIDAYIQGRRAEWPAWGMTVFDRQYDLHKAQAIGFTETRDIAQGYLDAFDLMRKAKIISK